MRITEEERRSLRSAGEILEKYQKAGVVSGAQLDSFHQAVEALLKAGEERTTTWAAMDYSEMTQDPFVVKRYRKGCIIDRYIGFDDVDLILPGSIAGLRVLAIESSAFQGAGKLKSVSIPEGVKTIGFGAFSGCANLRSVSLPRTLTVICNNAFRSTALEDVSIPDGVRFLGKAAFRQTPLKTLRLPASLKVLSEEAFGYCKNLKTVTIPEGVEVIEARAFYDCESLTRVTFPNTLRVIKEAAFFAAGLTEAELPPSIDEMARGAFSPPHDLVLKCVPGSYAQVYARTSGYPIQPSARRYPEPVPTRRTWKTLFLLVTTRCFSVSEKPRAAQEFCRLGEMIADDLDREGVDWFREMSTQINGEYFARFCLLDLDDAEKKALKSRLRYPCSDLVEVRFSDYWG